MHVVAVTHSLFAHFMTTHAFSYDSCKFCFLIHHHFAATEIYNIAIQVFIAAYVWMTGFGNFSYYCIRKDFSVAQFAQVKIIVIYLVSSVSDIETELVTLLFTIFGFCESSNWFIFFVQMMWRLNFFVPFCCIVLNNDYMLLYSYSWLQ